ncbi:hypothetical protein PMSD_27135 [Paenibacillus macquariensis subsp. defensor]|nr:hypothetical protein PMSD_27135 [Paenibacillus macquariensis subsp. defensor]
MQQNMVSFIADADVFAQFVRSIPVEELNYKPTATSWSITDIIVHVVDAEMILQHRIKAILAEDNPIIQAFDQNLWASELQYSLRDIEDQLALFVLLRKVFAPTLQIIRDVDGERAGIHSTDGSIQLKDIVKKMSTHLQGHIEQIERNRAAFVLLK